MCSQRSLALDDEIAELALLIRDVAEQSEPCRRALTVPVGGPIVSMALIAAVRNARAFKRGRDKADWLSLVPHQHTTGGKSTLPGISKRGNTYLRKLFIRGAPVLLINMKRDRSSLGAWLPELEGRRHRNVLVVTLANKLVRICWKLLATGTEYRPFR